MRTADATTSASATSTLTYHITALQMPIYFNAHGDHDHNGLAHV
jgi:manganese oxidase